MAIYENIVSIGTRKENILMNKILKCSFRFYNQTYIWFTGFRVSIAYVKPPREEDRSRNRKPTYLRIGCELKNLTTHSGFFYFFGWQI